MGTPEDDGWINAEDYDGYIPFESEEENEKRLAALHEKQAAANIVGDCPACGTHVIEREKGFFCDNNVSVCLFKIREDPLMESRSFNGGYRSV